MTMTRQAPMPPCPKCRRADAVEEEDQSGSSSRWFVCNSCGCRFSSKVSS